MQNFTRLYADGDMNKEKILKSMEGWNAYATYANTYKFRGNMMKKLHKSIKRIDKQCENSEQ
jgi:hypothetical protein